MKNKRIRISSILIFASVIIFTPRMIAQDLKNFAAKGTIEFGGSIAYQSVSLLSQGKEYQSYKVFSFLPYVGYFPVDNFEIGVNPLGFQSYWTSEDRTSAMTILLAPSYNFTTGSIFYPFIEGQVGYSREVISGATADLNPDRRKKDGVSYGLRIGVKAAIAGNSLLNVGLQYQYINLTPAGDADWSGSAILMLSAGFTFYL
jgi:hypothetical protein